MIKSLRLTLEVRGGSMLDDACADALAIAKKLDVTVQFQFNDTWILINPDSNLESVRRGFWMAKENNLSVAIPA